MKKLLIALAFVGLGTAANAQTAQLEAPSKYTVATNSFWSNWYTQIGVDMTLQNPQHKEKLAGKMFPDGKSFGLNLAVGKWFTPGLGLRAKVQWENGLIENKHNTWTPLYDDGGFGAFYTDVQFNLSNLFCGYSDSRVWNLIAYPRAGVVRNFGANTYAAVLGAGVQNTWKIAKKAKLYLDVAYNAATNDYMPVATCGNDHFNANGYITTELGVSFDLGKASWSKAVTLEQYNALAAASEEALAKLRAELDKERAENARLRAELAKAKSATPAPAAPQKVIASTKTSIFFEINSAKINSKKDLVNLEALAAAAKESGAKVIITGSADSQTGSSAWNQKLSENRAASAADELVRLGVNRDNITVKAVGGVNEVSPYTLNRRAVIELK